MKIRTKRAKKLAVFVEKRISEDKEQCKAHLFDHVERVFEIAAMIGDKEGADFEILEPAVLLHDIIKYPKEDVNHAVASAELAQKVLPDFGYSADETRKICDAIQSHSNSAQVQYGYMPKTTEAKVLYDADKVDAIGGMQAVQRALKVGEERGWTRTETIEWYLRRIFYVRRRLKLQTNTGKGLVKERLDEVLEWIKKELGSQHFEEISNESMDKLKKAVLKPPKLD